MLRLFFPLVAVLVWGLNASVSWAASVADLVSERATQDLGVEMPENGHFNVLLPDGSPETGLAIREFWIDHSTGQFIANLVEPTGQVSRISGLALLTLPVPVTKRRILPDEVIQADDIEMTDLPWQRVNVFAVLDPKDLIGMQAKRLIAQGRPVQLQSVTPPIVVSRGQEVDIELRHGALHLVTKGKAIGDAYLGQEVRVVNLSSNKTITAIARADGVVEARQ